MKRRDLLLGFAAGAAFTGANTYVWEKVSEADWTDSELEQLPDLADLDPPPFDPPQDSEFIPQSTLLDGQASANKPVVQVNEQAGTSSEAPAQAILEGKVQRDVTAEPSLSLSSELSSELPLGSASPESNTVAVSTSNASSVVDEALKLEEPAADLVAEAADVSRNAQAAADGTEPDVNLDKVRFFENEFADDIYLVDEEKKLLLSTVMRLNRVQKTVGHGNFNVLSFDDAIKFARKYRRVGEFTKAELAFMEQTFETQASDYGFFGEKVSSSLTDRIANRDIVKVPYSGHYLFRDVSLDYYEKLTRDVGRNIILTSGIRSNVKQMYLFLNKAVESEFNLSKASRSLAPPGHSFHGIGDFDVGRVGWGAKNFTGQFAETDEFKRMEDLGYVQIRYTSDNTLGVRYEPWHIKVV